MRCISSVCTDNTISTFYIPSMFLEQIANVIASLDRRHQLNSAIDPQPAAGVCTTSMTSAHCNPNTPPSLPSPPLLTHANDTCKCGDSLESHCQSPVQSCLAARCS